MGFLSWLTGTAPDAIRAADAPVVGSGPSVPARTDVRVVGGSEALTLGSVYRAVSIRATGIAQMSLDVTRGDAIIPRPSILRRPDLDTSLAAFLERTVISLNLAGNAYWRKHYDSAGSVNSLEVLNPHDVTIQTTASGRITAYSYRGHDLKPADVQHLSKLRVPGTPYGLGPIQAARDELRGALDLRDYAASWFASGDVPSGVLSTQGHLTDEQAATIHERWSQRDGRSVTVLGNGTTYSAVALSPEDAQFLQSQQWTVTSVARLFGVPSSLMLAVIDGNSMTYSNVSQEWLAFVRWGLADDIREIEEAFTAILPRGQVARFNVEALLRMDTATRYAAHEAGIRAGWLLPSEVREIEGLNPVEGIDERAPKTSAPKGDAA